MKDFKRWLEYRRHRYDVFEKPLADLIERVTALGYVLLDDEYSYKICREYDDRTLVVQFPKELIAHHNFVTSLLGALHTL